MKTTIITSIVILILIVSGCTKNIVEIPDIQVSTAEVTYKVGEPVTFQITGNPEFIYFYSGEIGNRFEYADRVSATGIPQLQFTSLRQNGTQEGSLRVMVSDDFPGVTTSNINDSITTVKNDSITKINIVSSSWSDITDRALLSSGTSTSSGIIDLSDFAQSGKRVFIAFKYLATAGTVQNKWTITNFTLKNVLPDGSAYTLANHTSTAISNYGGLLIFSPGWLSKTINGLGWWSVSTTKLIVTGATSVASATDNSEAWAIMGSVDLTSVAPDLGTPLKGLDTRLSSYSHNYSAAGTYTATFVGANNNVYGEKEVSRQIQITVIP